MGPKNTAAKRPGAGDEDKPIDWSKARVLGRGLHAKRGVQIPLQTLRAGMGKTRWISQKAPRSSRRTYPGWRTKLVLDDVQISTLKRYVAALGGRLELVATFDDRRYDGTLMGVRPAMRLRLVR